MDYELSLYEYADGILMGAEEEFISASQIDNLSMVYSALCGLIVDVGTPILAMHSVREFGYVADNAYSKKVFTTYYEQ